MINMASRYNLIELAKILTWKRFSQLQRLVTSNTTESKGVNQVLQNILKYNSEDFCLNSQSTPCLITEMNNWKIPRIQQNSSDIWREKGHIVESYEKQTNLIKKLFCSLGEREEITQRSTLPPYLILEAVKNSQIL